MPTLTNPKWERFAQELAKGTNGDEAYVLAGYKPNRHNASRLKTTETVSARVAEILQRSAAAVGITIGSVTADLLRIAEKAEALASAPGYAVARAARVDAANINGLVIDRKEIGTPGDFARMDDQELREFIAGRTVGIGSGGARARAAGSAGLVPGTRRTH